MRIKSVFYCGFLFCLLFFIHISLGAEKTITTPFNAQLIRNHDLSIIPKLEIENTSDAPLKIEIHSRLESVQSKNENESIFSISLTTKEKKIISIFKDSRLNNVTGQILLLVCDVQCESGQKRTLSAICGTPKPVNQKNVDVFGMNIHLARYTPEEQWKLLQLASAAGITSVREDAGFQMPNQDGTYSGLENLEQTVLACEAFGIEVLMNLSYFPSEYYTSPEKCKLCHDWAVAIAKHYKGRIHSWEYGNETNSGWGGYGAAADMAWHNMAMTQGTLSVDPDAKTASVGIAEGHPSYVTAMLENHAGEFLNAISVHPYCGTPEAGILKCMADSRVAAMNGYHQEIWATEIGFNYSEGEGLNPLTRQITQVNGYSLDQQADFIVRLYTLAMAEGIDRVYWYDFFGKNDPETFWIVDESYKPRPAYTALANLAQLIKNKIFIGGTDFDELVQKHYFKGKDGSIVLIVWALQDGVTTDLKFPKKVTTKDFLGRNIPIESNQPIRLGHRPIYIAGLTTGDISSFINKNILVNAMDKRNWNGPLHRFHTSPGGRIQVPCVIYNSTDTEIMAQPIVLQTMPGWTIEIPSSVEVGAGQTSTQMFTLTAPKDGIEGVEYHFDFAADINAIQRSLPYTVRIKVDGKFPYDEILTYNRQGNYSQWDSFNETQDGTGCSELHASFGEVKVDGRLNEWQAREFYPIDQKFMWLLRDPKLPDYRDWTGKVALRWDEKNLYAAFIVLDDDLSLLDFVSRDWRDNDNVRLFLSTEPDSEKRTDLISEKDYSLFMSPTGMTHTESPVVFSASIGGKIHNGIEAKIAIKSQVWSGGYLIEMAIPFDTLNYKPTAGAKMGLNVLSDDADYGFRQNTCMTYFKNPSYWNSPKTLGTLILDKE
jgi:hypothetical protein